jgi:hypothetical protein
MRRLSLFAWPLIVYFCFVLAAVATESDEGDNTRLRVSIREDTLQGVPSCQLTFSRIELINLVSFVACDIFGTLFSECRRNSMSHHPSLNRISDAAHYEDDGGFSDVLTNAPFIPASPNSTLQILFLFTQFKRH